MVVTVLLPFSSELALWNGSGIVLFAFLFVEESVPIMYKNVNILNWKGLHHWLDAASRIYISVIPSLRGKKLIGLYIFTLLSRKVKLAVFLKILVMLFMVDIFLLEWYHRIRCDFPDSWNIPHQYLSILFCFRKEMGMLNLMIWSLQLHIQSWKHLQG